jgi:hypothetical protein
VFVFASSFLAIERFSVLFSGMVCLLTASQTNNIYCFSTPKYKYHPTVNFEADGAHIIVRHLGLD